MSGGLSKKPTKLPKRINWEQPPSPDGAMPAHDSASAKTVSFPPDLLFPGAPKKVRYCS